MSESLRLLLIGPMPPPSGGMANQTHQLKRLLEGAGVTVALVSTNAPYSPRWIGSVRGVRAIFRLLPFLKEVFVETGRADVVHLMANSGWAWHLLAAPAILVASLRHVPVIVNYRGGLAEEFLASQAPIVARTMNLATELVVPSAFLQNVFSRFGMHAVIIPNIVDVTMFRPAQGLAAQAVGTPHVVVARNLEKLYGNDLAIRALAIVRRSFPKARMSIAGSGPELASLQNLASETGVGEAVRFTGRLEVADMATLYREADVVLNPSRADNTPNSILEALATGVPVVSTKVGGVPYLVKHGHDAWLVEPDSAEDIARGIEAVFTDQALRERLVANGLALAQSCAWDAVKDRWMDLYRRLKQPAAGRPRLADRAL